LIELQLLDAFFNGLLAAGDGPYDEKRLRPRRDGVDSRKGTRLESYESVSAHDSSRVPFRPS